MGHFNIGEFNRGQSSKLIRELVDSDNTAYIQKNGKLIAVIMSYERYQRLYEQVIDINDYQVFVLIEKQIVLIIVLKCDW